MAPRTEHGLIHGELGPDHVLVDASGHLVLIDIEGAMFFHVEWEHVFLAAAFQRPVLSRTQPCPAPDSIRAWLDLHLLAMRLSLVAGPLRLLDGGFPHRTEMRDIAEHNAREALAALAR